MADEPEEELLLDEEIEQAPEPPEPRPEDEERPEEGTGGDEEDVLVFGDEAEPAENDNGLVKHLRDEIRKRDRELAEARKAVNKPEPIVVGEKPTMASCEFDEEEFDRQYEAWQDRKAKAAQQQNQHKQADEAEREAWNAELQRYNDGKSKLGFADVDDAEETVKAALNTVQQAVIVKAADDPAKVIYALAKNPDRLTYLASVTDPLKLAASVARLEGQLKMVKRRKAPEPDTPVRGSARVSHQTADKQLEKLEKEAERTGDRTNLIAYRRKLAAKK